MSAQERRFKAPEAYRAPNASPPRLLEYDEADPPDPLRTPPTPPRGNRWRLYALILLLIPGGYVGYRALTRPSAPSAGVEGSLPPLIPSMMPSGGARELFGPLDGAEVAGPVGSRLALAVRARQPGGTPLAGGVVRFRVEAGEAELLVDSAQTDPDGLAEAVVQLPDALGNVIVVASLDEADLPDVRFDVSVEAGPPTNVGALTGNAQVTSVGGLLPVRLAVLVTDGGGNPVPNEEVRFQVQSGGGLAAPSRATSDSLGLASARWRLGPTPGEQELVAIVPATGESVMFTATARARDGSAPPDEPLPPPVGPVRVVPVTFAVGGSHVCRVVEGTVGCRGGNDRGQTSGAAGIGVRAIATGISHSCALDSEGAASCWGANESGQLGDGSRTDRPSPVRLAVDMRFSVLSAGAAHTCGLVTGGYAACWGQNLSGQLGDGTREDRTAPRVIAGERSFITLAAGWNHTCGLSANGDVLCWGLNTDGQLGDGSRLDRLVATRVSGPFRSVSAGNAHTCAIGDGEVMCWGDNSFGQLGDGSNEDRARPVAVSGLPAAPISLAAGAVHTCALVEGGDVYCWGQNLYGQLGDGTNQHRTSPTPVAGSLAFTRIFAGGAVTCGVSAEQVQYCWGLNQSGQLGDGTRINRSRPTRTGG